MAGKYPEIYPPLEGLPALGVVYPEGHYFDLQALDRPAGFFKWGCQFRGDV